MKSGEVLARKIAVALEIGCVYGLAYVVFVELFLLAFSVPQSSASHILHHLRLELATATTGLLRTDNKVTISSLSLW